MILAIFGITLLILAGLVVAFVMGAGKRRMPVPCAPGRTQLTRKWARAMYWNGLISVEELNHFYEVLPEDLPGPPVT